MRLDPVHIDRGMTAVACMACMCMVTAMARMIIMARVGILTVVDTMIVPMPVAPLVPHLHKKHSAFRAGARFVADHFGMHGAGILRHVICFSSMV